LYLYEDRPTRLLHEYDAKNWRKQKASPRLIGFESIAFSLFGAWAPAALANCFSEQFQLLNSGALDEAVRALLDK
jgi:hypothetical protein